MSADLRIGDREREAAVDALGEHYAAGRLSKDEYDERAETAWSARTQRDLTAPFADLPGPQPSGAEPPRAPSSTARSSRGRGARARWPMPLPVAVIALLVVLAATDVIPWFVAAIVGWFCWMGLARARWHCSPRRPRDLRRGW